MIPKTKLRAIGIFAILLLFLAVKPSAAKVFEWYDSSQNRQDLLLLGFGELTMQVLDVSGNVNSFKDANPALKEDFSTNYRLSLFANGNATRNFMINGAAIVDSRIGDEYRTIDPSIFRLKMSVESTEPIWDTWRFTGRGVYDPNRQWEVENLDTRLLTQPQEASKLELLMRLESEEHGLIEAGSLRPSFKDSKFSLHQRSLFGVYADLHSGAVGVEAVGGKLEGKSFREGSAEGIRADGTSGPYDLSNAPITRGSEEVKIEVRDRFNETTVISTTTLIRDIDYNVDYLRGRILLHQPVASESPSSDPVYIVITYDYQREENDELIGGRANVNPVDGVRVSGSYLHRFVDDQATGAGEEEPENLIDGDASFKVDDHTTGYVEVAGAENPNGNDNNSAFRAGIESVVIDNLKLNADYQRIDDQFRSFTNSDLNPTKNQQRLHLGGDYQLTDNQKAIASFVNIRGLEENGQFNTYNGIRDEKIYLVGYQNDLKSTLGFGAKLERRNIIDRNNSSNEDNYQNRAIVNVGGEFEKLGFLGQLGYRADYELIMFRNELDLGNNDANTNQLAVTMTSKPSENANIKFTQRFSLRNDRELDTYDERQDASFASVQLRPHTNFNTLTTFEYKRYTAPGSSVQLWQDDPVQTEKAGTFAAEYLPLDKIKALGKVGRHQSKRWFTDSTTRVTDDFVLGQLTYFHTHHLSFNAESEFRRRDREYSLHSRDKTWDLGLRVNWNRDRLNEFTAGLVRRWQLQDLPPNDEITSSSYIMLVSGAMSFMRQFFIRGSIKEILLNDPLDDEKTFTKLEVGYDSNRWYRVSIGYERIESDIDQSPDLDYTGQGVFIRFTGKM